MMNGSSKYQEALHKLPDVQINIVALMGYAQKKGVKAGDLSEEEKNQFIIGGTVESLRKK